MAVRKSAAKKRLLSVSQQFVLEKVKRAFDDVLSANVGEFLQDNGEGNLEYVLQLWDCFADVYPKIQASKPGELNVEEKRQIVADLMVWSSLETSDPATKRFILEPHLNDAFFLSIGRHLREAMAVRGMLVSNDKDSVTCIESDSESQGSNWGNLNEENQRDHDHEPSNRSLLTGSS